MSGLPRNWSGTVLGEVLLSVVGGGTPSRNVPAYFEGNIPWFTVKDMKSSKPSDAEEHITESAVSNSSTNLFPANTLVVATRIALGRAIRPSVAFAINQDLKALMLGQGIDADFLLYWVGANERAIQELGSGTTVSGIRLEALHGLPLLLPPASEQTRIVAKLEELLSDLDAGVAELKAAQKKLQKYRQSLLKAAIEGALTADWREAQRQRGTPTETGAQLLARVLTERRARWEAKQLTKFKEQGKAPPKDWQKKYLEPALPSTLELPALPEGWIWATTGLIAESIVPNRDKPLTFTGDIPWITTPDFEQPNLHLQKSISGVGLSEVECATYRAKVVPPQGVIMTCVGRFGLSAVLDVGAVINQQLHAFIPEPSVRSDYLAYVIQAQRNWLERHATSTTIAYLNKERCEGLPVPLPSLVEQDSILALLAMQLSSITEQLCNVDLSLKQSVAQRQNLLRAAFAGQLLPQDPEDEPADVLLNRIRNERTERAASLRRARPANMPKPE